MRPKRNFVINTNGKETTCVNFDATTNRIERRPSTCGIPATSLKSCRWRHSVRCGLCVRTPNKHRITSISHLLVHYIYIYHIYNKT